MSHMTTTARMRKFVFLGDRGLVRRIKPLPPAHLFYLPCDCTKYPVHNGMIFRHENTCPENKRPGTMGRPRAFSWNKKKYGSESDWLQAFGRSKVSISEKNTAHPAKEKKVLKRVKKLIWK